MTYNLSDYFQAIYLRHGVVDDQKVDRGPVLKDAEHHIGAARFAHNVTIGFQQLANQAPHVVIVVAQQNVGRALSWAMRPVNWPTASSF